MDRLLNVRAFSTSNDYRPEILLSSYLRYFEEGNVDLPTIHDIYEDIQDLYEDQWTLKDYEKYNDKGGDECWKTALRLQRDGLVKADLLESYEYVGKGIWKTTESGNKIVEQLLIHLKVRPKSSYTKEEIREIFSLLKKDYKEGFCFKLSRADRIRYRDFGHGGRQLFHVIRNPKVPSFFENAFYNNVKGFHIDNFEDVAKDEIRTGIYNDYKDIVDEVICDAVKSKVTMYHEGRVIEKLQKFRERSESLKKAVREKNIKENGELTCVISGFQLSMLKSVSDFESGVLESLFECCHKKGKAIKDRPVEGSESTVDDAMIFFDISPHKLYDAGIDIERCSYLESELCRCMTELIESRKKVK